MWKNRRTKIQVFIERNTNCTVEKSQTKVGSIERGWEQKGWSTNCFQGRRFSWGSAHSPWRWQHIIGFLILVKMSMSHVLCFFRWCSSWWPPWSGSSSAPSLLLSASSLTRRTRSRLAAWWTFCLLCTDSKTEWRKFHECFDIFLCKSHRYMHVKDLEIKYRWLEDLSCCWWPSWPSSWSSTSSAPCSWSGPLQALFLTSPTNQNQLKIQV